MAEDKLDLLTVEFAPGRMGKDSFQRKSGPVNRKLIYCPSCHLQQERVICADRKHLNICGWCASRLLRYTLGVEMAGCLHLHRVIDGTFRISITKSDFARILQLYDQKKRERSNLAKQRATQNYEQG